MEGFFWALTVRSVSFRMFKAPSWAVQDLRECVKDLQSGGEHVKDGMAPVYGLASVSPDRNIIGEFLVAYQDVLLSG